MIDAKLSQEFWGEADLTATFLINIIPSRALKGNKTPFELRHGKKPQSKYLKVFGSSVYVYNKMKSTKFESKS